MNEPTRVVEKDPQEFLPARLKLALELRGLSQSQVAARMGISAVTLSRVLSGFTTFSTEHAELAATALGVPLTFFILRGADLPEEVITFRKTSNVTVKDLRKVRAEYAVLSQSVDSLESMTGIAGRTDWINAIAPASTPSLEDIEGIAQRTREHLGIPSHGPVDNVTRRLEEAGIVVAPMATALSSAATHNPRLEGIAAPELAHQSVVLGYFKGSRSGDGIRFTVAHEAGHAILQRRRSPQTTAAAEREASLFAASLLFPEPDARAAIASWTDLRDYAVVKAGWGVSIASLISRAYTLGIIDSSRRRSLMMQLSARGWRTHEPVHVAEERPVYLKQMIGSSFGTIDSPTEVTVSRTGVEQFLGMPFSMVNTWADGLKVKNEEQGLLS